MKLSAADISEIKRRLNMKAELLAASRKSLESAEKYRLLAKNCTYRALADKFGVHKTIIQHISESMDDA